MEGFCQTMLSEFASEFLDSNALSWVKIKNGMEILNFSLFYRKCLKFLPTFYSFLLFFTILDHLNYIDVVGAHFECSLTMSSTPSCLF